MMANRITQWLVMAVALLLLSTYIYLNHQKLLVLTTYWSNFRAGPTAPVARIKLAEEVIYQQRLNITDILDSTGSRQINIISVPKVIFEKIVGQLESARLLVDNQALSLSSSGDKSALLAIATDRKIYLVADNTLKPMMTVIWNEQRQLKNIIQCMTPDLCKTLLISSLGWGPLEGPFSDSEFSADRRTMPRGRWVLGPATSLNIQSKSHQKVWMTVSLLAVHPDQEISFQGAVSRFRKLDTKSSTLTAGGRSLTPSVHTALLELQPGSNEVEMIYSQWESAVGDSANPIAAYITTITVDKEGMPEVP